MKHYEREIGLYFELKGTPESSKESYLRRIRVFVNFIQGRHKCMEEIAESDIQQYILYLKKEKGLSPGTINNYISAIKFFHTHVLGNEWDPKKVPRMKRTKKPKFEGLKTIEILCLLVGRDVTMCPVCGEGKMRAAYLSSSGSSP